MHLSKKEKLDSKIEPVYNEAEKFISLLTGGPSTECYFQVFYDNKNKSKKEDFPAKLLIGSLKQHFKTLCTYNKRGYGVFVTVNKCTAQRRIAANVTEIRAAFYDADSNTEPVSPIQPSIRVRSGEGFHGYLLLKQGLEISQFTEIQKNIIKKLGTDPSIHDLPRVMRLPGFFHLKDPLNPKYTHIIESTDKKYSPEELYLHFPSRKEALLTDEKNNLTIDRFVKWSEGLPTGEGATQNKYGGRNCTVVLLCREGLATQQESATLKAALYAYCIRSNFPINDANEILNRQTAAHEKSNFESYFLHSSSKKLIPAQVAESYLFDRGYYRYSATPSLAYWRDDFYKYDGTYYQKIQECDLQADLISFITARLDLKNNFSKRHLAEITTHFKAAKHILSEVEPGTFLENPQSEVKFICTKNTILSIEKNRIQTQKHNPSLFSLACLNTNYEPKTVAFKWKKILGEIMPDTEDQEFLQEWFGYNLIFDTSQTKALILFGSGANGKSVITTVLQTLLGRKNVSSVALESLNPERTYSLASTIGKLANIVDEMGDIRKIAEGLLKQIIGGSIISAEHKNKPFFDSKPTVRLTYATNNLPRFSDRSDGIWRRFIIIEMTQKILDEKTQDKRLIEADFWEETGELPGILNWALDGLKNLKKRGHFKIPASSEKFATQYRAECDHILSYFNDCIEENIKSLCGVTTLYRHYVHWTGQQHHRALSPIEFAKEVKKHFKKVEKSEHPRNLKFARERIWAGISILGEA